MRSIWQDVRYSLRGLMKSPTFTVVALLSLALGIGANTAIFSLLDQALLRPLPVQEPDKLVLFSSAGPRRGRINTNYNDLVTFSYPAYAGMRDSNPVFDGLLARFPVKFSLSWHDRTERVSGELVSGNYFEVLGVGAAIGRTFTPDDDRVSSAQPVAVLSYAYWKSRFSSDPGVLNQTVVLNNHPMTIVGVAQREFRSVGITEAPDIFVPISMTTAMFPGGDDIQSRHSMWLNIFGRLKPDLTQARAEADIQAIWRAELEQEIAGFTDMQQSGRTRYLNRHLSLLPAARGISGIPRELGIGLAILMSMVGVLLLIACANVANLLTARATARKKEIGIRIALGAGRMRIARQLMLESLLLALGGGALGVLVAAWTGQLLLGFLPADPAAAGIAASPDPRVLLFALALSFVTSLLFGLVPALQGTRAGVGETLKDQAASVVGGHAGVRRSLVVSQIALSLVLLIGAGLFARSLYNVKNIDAGFRTGNLISFTIQPSFSGYDQTRTLGLYRQLQENIAALSGVRASSMSQIPTLSGDADMSSVSVVGQSEDKREGILDNFIGPRYFATLGIPLLAGRDFNAQDTASAPKAAIINEAMAQKFFSGENPIGRRIQFGRTDSQIEIVGVVRSAKYRNLREDAKPFIYYPYTQHPSDPPMTFYARTAQDPRAIAALLQDQVRRLDPNLPVFSVMTMERQIDESIFTDRLVAALSSAFGALATILATVGLYGVMAYMVARRTREIGIRMALGADRRRVLRIVLREVAWMAAIGITIALAAGAALGRLMESLLFGVSGHDPLVFIGATAVLALVALAAGYIPALRATRIDPLVALRYE